MDTDRERWNQRYTERAGRADVATLVRDFVPVGAGRALDLACGDGGNCELLAERGYQVDAVDIADTALRRIANRPGIHTICADLDTWRPSQNTYHLGLMIMFFDRHLLGALRASVVPGGRLIIKCFTHAPDGTLTKSTNPAFASRPGELLDSLEPALVLHHNIAPRHTSDSDGAWIEELVAEV